MDNSWVKLYRKAADNPVLFDSTALRIFFWLLTQVDKKDGKITVGRFQAAQRLRLNNNTFYKALKRLEKKYKIVTLNSNNKYTEISLLNWAKYQSTDTLVTLNGNNKVTTREQQSNTKQEDKNIEIRKIIAKKSQSSLNDKNTSKTYERLPVDKQQPLHRICYLLEDITHAPIVNWGKQAKALKMMESAGYTEAQICYTIKQMYKLEDWREGLGFDLMDVTNRIPKYKAQAGRLMKDV